jgi:hypothetical protein
LTLARSAGFAAAGVAAATTATDTKARAKGLAKLMSNSWRGFRQDLALAH